MRWDFEMKLCECNRPGYQRGAVLVITLVFLIAISMLTVSSMQSSNIGLRMAQNEESRIAAAQGAQALADAIVSTPAATLADHRDDDADGLRVRGRDLFEANHGAGCCQPGAGVRLGADDAWFGCGGHQTSPSCRIGRIRESQWAS